MSILVTGGAGFIGSNFILHYLSNNDDLVINVDKLNYAGNLDNLATIENDSRYRFYHTDIIDNASIANILKKYKPSAIVHFAAESHVDNSIKKPYEFVSNNILGTFSLLDTTYDYFQALSPSEQEQFRFIQISTDEVYGSLNTSSVSSTEESPYSPNSPYAASKASADHLARAWSRTYNLPVITSKCSNNYGPRQYPEKLIPVVIFNALSGRKIPVYGDGMNIRDWLYVDDHCKAIEILLKNGTPGETYNIGGNNQITNKQVVMTICSILDEYVPLKDKSYTKQISYVEDRRGHDRRYSIDSSKMKTAFGWQPTVCFTKGIGQTIGWYLENPKWLHNSLNLMTSHRNFKDELLMTG